MGNYSKRSTCKWKHVNWSIIEEIWLPSENSMNNNEVWTENKDENVHGAVLIVSRTFTKEFNCILAVS